MDVLEPTIVWYQSQTGETQLWFMDGHRLVRRGTVLAEDGTPIFIKPPWAIVGAGDMDGDGKSDIVWYNSQTGETQIWFLDDHRLVRRGTVLAEDGTTIFIKPPWAIVGAGDMDGDGKSDIVWYNDQTGETQIWFMDGHRLVRRGTVLAEDGTPIFIKPPWAIVGAGDMDGDGMSDIVWYNDQTGETQIWFMDGHRLVRRGTVLAEDGTPIFIKPPWAIVGAGDMDGDGMSDIVWYNSQTGETQIWFMDDHRLVRRGTVLAEDGTTIFIKPPWAIVGASSAATRGWDGVVHDLRPSKIKHVFVLMLENRSFDHMLGFSGITGTNAKTGKPTSINGLKGNEFNVHDGVQYAVSRGAPDVAAHDPGHGFGAVLEQLCGREARYEVGGTYPPINNSGFVSNYARSHPELPDGAMKCFTPDQVPVITALAREFLVCDRWFCSMPGPTEPNRWFVHAGTAGTFDESPTHAEYVESMSNPLGGVEFDRGTIYDLLRKAGVKFRIYAGDETPNVALLDGVSRTWDVDDFDDDFAEDVASPSYDAAYTFIEPNYDVIISDFKAGNSQHPLGSVMAGELLIKRTYEALRRSPIWESSMLVVLYDEHGGFYDHVAPPSAQATGSTGRKFGFAFNQLGPRVPAIVVSPLIPRNQIDHRRYEHSSIISTLTDLFHLDALTARSSASSGLKHLATLGAPRADAPMTLPDPRRGAVARMVRIPLSGRVAERPDAPLSDDPHGTLSLAVRSGLAQHLEVAPPAEHEDIRARVKALSTRREALEYLKRVAALVAQARAGAGVRRSATVRSHRSGGMQPR